MNNNNKLVFILGGAKSGKSRFALKMASELSGRKAYAATAQALDDEMKERIAQHKKERGTDWTTIEEPLYLAPLIKKIHTDYDIIIIDCLTLWLSNLLLAKEDIEVEIARLIDALRITHNPSRIFIVSNEVGLGIVPDNALSRRFRDLSGYLNQKMAAIADEVYFITAGIPLKIK